MQKETKGKQTDVVQGSLYVSRNITTITNVDPILINPGVLVGGCPAGFSGELDHVWEGTTYF